MGWVVGEWVGRRQIGRQAGGGYGGWEGACGVCVCVWLWL